MNDPKDTPAKTPPEKPISVFEQKRLEMQVQHKMEMDGLNRMSNVLTLVPQSLAKKCSIQGGFCLDFDYLSREEALTIMRLLGAGTWKKKPNFTSETLIDYSGVVDGVQIRLWAAAPPDSCRVIEFEEVIPAKTVIHRRLVCSKEVEMP